MANAAKKTTSADVKDTAVKTAEVKAPAETKTAAEVKTEAAAKPAAPKAEKKTEAKKPGRKPAAKKETAEKTEKKPAAKKETAKKEAAKTEKKPAAKKTTAKKTEAAKPAAKRGRPAAAAKAEEKAAPAKRGAKKKQLSYEEVVDAARKKAMAANVTNVKVHIAANIILTGNFSENGNDNESKNQFYIEINPETESINVQPYRYEENTFEISADAEELFKVLKGKKNIYDALSDGDFHIHGKTKPAVLFIHAVF